MSLAQISMRNAVGRTPWSAAGPPAGVARDERVHEVQ
jgi:hypothetical protein